MADRRLQVFHAVAKHLSFTKAAETLFMTQPAVTFQVKQLEEHLSTRLFDRAQGRISLTPAGVVALEYAELIGKFKARFPAVVPILFVGNSEAVQERVAERSLDLGFIEGDSHLASLLSEVCCEDELQLVCAPSHPMAKEAYALPASLTQHPYISREAGSGTRAVIDRYLHEAGVAPDSLDTVVELGSPEALKGLVATGLGFAIMSRVIAAKELELGQLVQIPLRPPLLRNFSVVYPKERFHSKLVSSFLQFARVRLAGMHPPGLAASALQQAE